MPFDRLLLDDGSELVDEAGEEGDDALLVEASLGSAPCMVK